MTPADNHNNSALRLPSSIRRTFAAGLIVILPGLLIIVGVLWFFNIVDGILQPVIGLLFGHPIRGLGVLLTIVLLYLIGTTASNIIGRNVIRFGESLVRRLPVLGDMYSAAKQVMQSLTGTGSFKKAFHDVVLIEYPTQGIFTIGFVTNEMRDLSGIKLISVYLPTAPTPQTGVWILMTEDQIIDTDLTVQKALEMTMSMGIISPECICVKRRTI